MPMRIYKYDEYMIAWNYTPHSVEVGAELDLTGRSERYFDTMDCCDFNFHDLNPV